MNYNVDSLASAMTTGEGNQSDNMTGFVPMKGKEWVDSSLLTLFRFTGLAKTVVKMPIDRCVRAGFSIKHEDVKKVDLIEKMMKKVKFIRNAKKLMYWNDVFGGGVMILGVKGTGLLNSPLDPTKSKGVDFLRVYRREEIEKTQHLNTDKESDRFGLPEFYSIRPSNGSEYKVHWSRVIELDGEEVDDEVRIQNNGWGDSKYYAMFDQIVRTESTYSALARSVKDHSSFAIEIAGLFDAIAEGKEADIMKRLRLFQRTRDSMNVLVHDSEESIDKITTNLTGLSDLLISQLSGLSLVSEILVRLLSGSQGGGLNNNGEGETGDWTEKLEEIQESIYEPIVERVVELCAYAVGLTDYDVEMGEIDRPTMKQLAEVSNIQSQSDERNIKNKILHPSEVRTSRFGGDEYSLSTKIDEAFSDIVFEPTETAPPSVPAPAPAGK